MADYDLFTDLTAALAAAESVFAARFGGLTAAVSLDGFNPGKSLAWNKRKLAVVGIDVAKFSDGSDVITEKPIDEMSVAEKAAACLTLEPLFQRLSEKSAARLDEVAKAVAHAKAFVEKHSPEGE